jgi:hypothetical protein
MALGIFFTYVKFYLYLSLSTCILFLSESCFMIFLAQVLGHYFRMAIAPSSYKLTTLHLSGTKCRRSTYLIG